jgi:RNA polymerase sigma-70 factor, ECF subfamily
MLAKAASLTRESDTRAESEIAFEQVVREHSRLAYRVAYAVLRNSADAEDAVQETFLRAFKAINTDVLDWAGWIARVAYRVAMDSTRRRKHVDVAEFEFVDPAEGQEEVLGREQQVRRLRALIAGLPEELRHPLELSAIEELNSRQIAEVLGVNEGTVRTRLMRARQLLKEKFEVAGKKR